jgi:hypothetical protein
MNAEKKFGYFFTLLFLATPLALAKVINLELIILCLIISCFFLVITIFNFKILYLLNNNWMRLSVLISKISNPLILGFLFFGILTPYAIALKIFRRDELRLRKSETKSFWIVSEKVEFDSSFFKNQF